MYIIIYKYMYIYIYINMLYYIYISLYIIDSYIRNKKKTSDLCDSSEGVRHLLLGILHRHRALQCHPAIHGRKTGWENQRGS